MTAVALFHVAIYLILWGIVLYVLWWGLGKMAPVEPFGKILTFILVVLTVVVVLNPLFGYMPGPVIHWQ